MLNPYQEAIAWLYQQFPSYQNKGASAYKPGLNNVKELMWQLNIDVHQLKYIHVAGTNGKGSTCAYLASALKESGQKVGLFTSPHIKDFRERIRVNGEMIAQEEVINFVEKVKMTEINFSPSFFELTFALAIQHFIQCNCSIVVLETGLGGRLDATNIVTPILSIITSIGLDHQDLLGGTRKKIAVEKAGIIKANVPVIIGEKDDETFPIFYEKSNQMNAPIYYLNKKNEDYLFHNKLIALKGLSLLKGREIQVTEEEFDLGVKNISKNTGLKGRMQVICELPLTIIDAAHNVDGIKMLVNYIENTYSGNIIHAVFGSSNDKDHASIFSLLPKSWTYFFSTFKNQRSLSNEQLRCLAEEYKLISTFFTSPKEALISAQKIDFKDVVVICFGSFFLLEEIF